MSKFANSNQLSMNANVPGGDDAVATGAVVPAGADVPTAADVPAAAVVPVAANVPAGAVVPASTLVPPTALASFADWQKLEIRVGTITAAHNPEWSEKLIELRVDFGPAIGERTIFTGIRAWYAPQDLLHKQGLFITNLQPRKMGPSKSEGMFISVDSADETGRPHLILFDHLAPDGAALC